MKQKQTTTEKIAEGIYWVGVFDDDLKVFDIVMETKYGTTYNAYVVNTTEGAVLVETVKEVYLDSYLEKLKAIVGDLNNIKYLITNHTEPDHSGSIKKITELIPGVTVVGSKTAITYLKDIINEPFQYRTAEDLVALKLGGKTFEFISVPFLHWPDSIYSYLKEDKILFTCDSFGAHYSPKVDSILISKLPQSEEEGYQDALLYYYTAIFSPFKEYVLKAYEKIKDLELKVVCQGHGPVLDTRIWEIINTYKDWSQLPVKGEKKKIVVVYASAYGYTTEVGEQIMAGIKESIPDVDLKSYMVNIQNYSGLKAEIMGEILTADGVLLGTNTINGDAVPPIWDIALSMSPVVHVGKILSAFGSYGWGGEGVENIIARMNQLRGKVLDGFRIKLRLSDKEKQEAKDFGKLYGKCVLNNEVPEKPKPRVVGAANWEELNPEGKVVLWRCIICGEIYAGVAPPLTCPACGAPQELFELYTPEEVGETSTEPLKFVIIGTGAAAVASADAIRARNKVGTITLISNEDRMPYYRPIVVDILERKPNDEEFYLRNERWAPDNKIDIHLKTEVTKVDPKAKKVITSNGEFEYDKLIFATGATPFVPPALGGSGVEGVIVIRSAASAEQLKEKCKTAKKAVLIGGGVLGLENAYSLKSIGLDVTVTEIMDRLMPRLLTEAASLFLAERVKEYGIDLRLSAKTSIVSENGKLKAVNINGVEEPADIVIINAGTRANIELAKEAGVTCGRGITVNEKMETNLPNIYAAGDCAFLNEMNQGLWAPALEMGKVAGANATGDNKKFEFCIEPVSLLANNVDVLAVGMQPTSTEGYNVFTQNDPVSKQFSTLYFKEDKLVYGVAFNMQKKAGVIINGVRRGHSPSRVISDLYA
ncbi:MBL fold metallo-hydrolase [Histomonas meleagridis]|uniref:MBL fold metallo-hydrolase n=1 Tax=Histomonas meleagridis TaxID=135588 RepID=UPI00355999EE|nr:MBL fold metallo-hydrolase [Histomonas meleagridis]KAH0807041.1 MBL fold metallo-hydrolase [Histomonas meleagridis]